MSMAVFQKSFIYKSRWQAGFDPGGVICQLLLSYRNYPGLVIGITWPLRWTTDSNVSYNSGSGGDPGICILLKHIKWGFFAQGTSLANIDLGYSYSSYYNIRKPQMFISTLNWLITFPTSIRSRVSQKNLNVWLQFCLAHWFDSDHLFVV